MGLVGTEGALAMEDAHGHDTECVGNRNGEDSHYHGGRTVCIIKNHASSGIVHGAHDEPRHEDAHNHRTGIAYEHTTLIAEYIMYKEQEQRRCYGECQHGIHIVANTEELKAEEHAACYAQAGGKTVDAIHHVDGIDNAHSCKDGEWNSHYRGDIVNAPQAVKGVHTDARGVYQTQDNEYLYEETRLGGEAHDVVHATDIKHDTHTQHYRQQSVY